MRRPAGGQKESRPAGASTYRLPPWDRRKPLTLTVKYRGGSECWYEIHSRGAIKRVPGHVALHDLMRDLYR